MVRAWLVGTGLGAALTYFLDGQSGRRRRAQVRDKLIHARKAADQAAGKAARDAAHRWSGLVAETKTAFSREDVPDGVLAERVRAKIGRVCSHPAALEVRAENG